jgi:hypothetical protein
MSQDARGLRVGYARQWFDAPARAAYQPGLDTLRDAGATPHAASVS